MRGSEYQSGDVAISAKYLKIDIFHGDFLN